MMNRWSASLALLIMVIGLPLAASAKTTDEERKIGKEAADQIAKDKTYKLVSDSAIIDRVERIGKVVAAYADEPDLTYSFKVIDSPVVNAFSLPGGYIYLNKGLIDHCQSDDELAGVIGHEITHAAHHHMRKLMDKQKKMDWATLAVLLVGAASHADVGNAALLTQMVTLARVNGFGMKFETEADHYAVVYLSKSPYNPVGVLTFMERLARDDAWTGSSSVDLGVYQDHPLSIERVKTLTEELHQMNIPIERRKVMSSLRVIAKAGKVGDQPAGEVWIGPTLIARLAGDGTVPPIERAQAVALRLDSAMDQKLGVQDVRIGPDGRSILAGKSLLVTVLPTDAELSGESEEAVARDIQRSVQSTLWKQFYNSIF